MTHGISYLPQVDMIVTLVDGYVTEIGSYDDLKSSDGAFSRFLQTYSAEEESEENKNDGIVFISKLVVL